jgi:muramoyltetrapeptide carboxypeptidase LdcA involved in peptidoglycan recycling
MIAANTGKGWELNAQCDKTIPGHENCQEIRVINTIGKEHIPIFKRAAKARLNFLGDLILFRYAFRRHTHETAAERKAEKAKRINEMSQLIEMNNGKNVNNGKN